MNNKKFNASRLEMLINIVKDPKNNVKYTGRGYIVTTGKKPIETIFEIPLNDKNYIVGQINLGDIPVNLSQKDMESLRSQLDSRINKDENKKEDVRLVEQLKYLKGFCNN